MDLYGGDTQAIQLGASRRREVSDLNQRISSHNKDLADQLSGLQEGIKTQATIQQGVQTAQGLWGGAGMPDKIKAYSDWRDGKTGGTNPTAGAKNTQTGATAGEDLTDTNQAKGLFGKGVKTGGGVETVDTSNIQVTAKDYDRAGNEVTQGESLAETDSSLGGTLKSGISRVTGVSKGALTEGLEMAGKGATGVAAAGIIGEDLYNDFKKGGWGSMNTGEKIGNVLQIGGAVSDIVGMAFPPAKLLGGILDVTAGVTDIASEQVAEGTKEKDAATTEQSQLEQGVGQAAVQTQVTGRTQ